MQQCRVGAVSAVRRRTPCRGASRAGASLARRNGLTWCGAARAQADDSDVAVELLLAAARAMAPVIRRFISLGLNRVWLDAGDTVYQCAPGPGVGPLPGFVGAWTCCGRGRACRACSRPDHVT